MPEIELKDIVKTYKNQEVEIKAVDNISLKFSSCQIVSILGASGCGKTSLLNIIGGLDKPTSGEVFFDGKKFYEGVSEKERNAFRNQFIGFIFQDYYLIPQLNVIDNVKLALSIRGCNKKEANKKALDALNKVGIASLAKKKPNCLSGGQKQRVAIARAIVSNPKIILADEPTGSLDSKNAALIMDILKELSKDTLIIMVTHNQKQALDYSSRIITMKDGRIEKDENNVPSVDCNENKIAEKVKVRSLSLSMRFKLAFKNIFSRKWKSIVTGLVNSFGMVGIAFLLAINSGFNIYSYNLSSASATTLPIVISAYDVDSETESYDSKNASITYPDTDEIYPSVSLESVSTYKHNNFSSKYLSYLDSLKDEGLIYEYISSYSSSYLYNLSTCFPKSLDGESESYYSYINTSMKNYSYYAYQAKLSYNIFHVLYGNMDQYDLLTGSLPKNKNELVLVVDKYNSVDFSILQALGFYNSKDSEKDVEDSSLESKVKPISFSDILNKEYKIFSNDEIYKEDSTYLVSDANDVTREVTYYNKQEMNKDFYDNHGTKLKITGIIRAKKNTPFVILKPSLCFTSELQDELASLNMNSTISSTFKNNLVFADGKNSSDAINDFINDINSVITTYQSDTSSSFPTSTLNSVISDYFHYYPLVDDGYYYIGVQTFLSQAINFGIDLIPDDIKNLNLSDTEELNDLIERIKDEFFNDYKKVYDDVISLIAYANAFSNIQYLVIFPSDLESRSTLLERLDSFNDIQAGSKNHAANTNEQVIYNELNTTSLITEVGDMISLVSTVLVIYAAISLIVSIAMTALMTSNSVLERRKEIGLLRALGTRRSDILISLEIESLIIALISGILAIALTFIFSIPLNNLINSMYGIYYVDNIVNMTWLHAIIVLIISLVVAFIASFIPSLKASLQNPADNLKSE